MIQNLIDGKLRCGTSGGSNALTSRKIPYTQVPFVRDIFPWINKTFPGEQDQAVRYLTDLFSSSTHNRIVATEGRLTSYIAENLHKFAEDSYFESVMAMFVELCKFSVEGGDLKTVFMYITGKRSICDGPYSVQRARQLQVYRALVTILNESNIAAPSKFFLLEGSRNESSLQIDNNTIFDKKWPNFTSLESIGFEVLLKEDEIIIRTYGGNSCVNIKNPFQIGKWYHLCLFHYNKKDYLRTIPTLCIYINGVLEHELILKFPTTTGPLSQRVIGNVKSQYFVPRTKDTTLRGGITSVAIGTGAPLAPEAVAHIYNQGPEFVLTTHYLQTILRSSIELDFVITPHSLNYVLISNSDKNAAISNHTLRSHNADISPKKKGSLEYSKALYEYKHGITLTDVKIVSCTNAKTAFFSSLGVRALIPLFHPAVLEQWPEDSLELAARITAAALRNDKREYIEYISVKGSEAITGLLSMAVGWKSQSQTDLLGHCLNKGAIAAFCELGSVLECVYGTRGSAYMPLLLNFDCWLKASAEMQRSLSEASLVTLSIKSEYYKSFIGVEQILSGVSKYGAAMAAGTIGTEDATAIRAILCKILEFFYLKVGERVTLKDVAVLCTFVKVSTLPQDICDAMHVLLKGLQCSIGTFTNLLADLCDEGDFFLRLVGNENIKIRHTGIKAIGLFLSNSFIISSQKIVVREFPYEKLFSILLRYRLDYGTYLILIQLYTLDYSDDVCSV